MLTWISAKIAFSIVVVSERDEVADSGSTLSVTPEKSECSFNLETSVSLLSSESCTSKYSCDSIFSTMPSSKDSRVYLSATLFPILTWISAEISLSIVVFSTRDDVADSGSTVSVTPEKPECSFNLKTSSSLLSSESSTFECSSDSSSSRLSCESSTPK